MSASKPGRSVGSKDKTVVSENDGNSKKPPLPSVPVKTAGTGQHTQNYIEAYHATAEWIRFADAKAAVILTVGGALAGLLIPTISQAVGENTSEVNHWIPGWQFATVTLFALFMGFLLLSGVFAFLCINPLRRKGRHPALEHCDHFHPAAISARYSQEQIDTFVSKCKENGAEGLLQEVQAALLLDSHISTLKYNKVKISLRLFAASVFFGFAYFLVLQF